MLLVQGQPSEQPRRRLRRKTAVGHLPIDVAGAAIPAQGQPSEEQPRRRLRGKITVGHLAIGVAAVAIVAAVATGPVWKDSFFADQDLSEEAPCKRKSVYLVTLPHPKNAFDGAEGLRSPDSFSHGDVIKMFLDIFAQPDHVDAAAGGRGARVSKLKKMVVFKEMHAPDEQGVRHAHYHIALVASESFRFTPCKRALHARHHIASHWSCSHDGYWSAVRYGFFPTPKKQQSELDAKPLCWARNGPHPPLFESSQPGTTVEATLARRAHITKVASEEGKAEPRANEMDLYAVIVAKGFRNTPDEPWAPKKLMEYLKTSGSPALFQYAFKIRQKLSGLIDDVWEWETVSDELALLSQSRLERLVEAGRGPCSCGGYWRYFAEWALQANGINPKELCGDVWNALRLGRCESLPVLVLMGKSGGEGKSFFFNALKGVFGVDHVQGSPESGSFPLLGLETKRVALLDEWDFSNDILPFSTQLLWYEGKAIPIKRPQNNHVGHFLYKGSAPVFVTCKEMVLGPILSAARKANEQGLTSEVTMLARRLKVFSFHQKLPIPAGTQISHCPCCFSQMIQHYASQAGSAAAA